MAHPSRTLEDWLAYVEQQHPKAIELGLERVREVATRMALGAPASQVIVVGGTNGKGSTVAFIEAIARAAGRRVGAYTSPHLLRYNERVRIDGREAADAALVSAFEAVEAARGDIALTYFEYGTLAALLLFQRSALDLAVLEVGLGGRLDAVNLVDADVAVITTVDIDHVDWLGGDREAIGAEKARIARAWKPLVLGEVDSPSSVLRHAYAIGANAIRMGSDFFHDQVDDGHWRWRDAGFQIELPTPLLRAPVQRANAATAIAALRALDAEWPDAALVEGVASASLPGRLQAFERDGIPVIVDVGHNPQAARQLATWLRAGPVPGRTLAVFAALADKDIEGVAAAMQEQVQAWFLAGLEGVAGRGQAVAAFADRLHAMAAGSGSRHADVRAALQAALHEARAGDRILVFGSFHTVAEALAELRSGR
ncbi:MAG: bifunctional tetrahydrofolate synthase/dihydrofolate synthase [Lysobacteraceae bacterium]|nr:MAG: bifunctional tetrahydrofolate synthase/dihydrofolate synthase [Xanthomonadaceae bacterium]